jgi:serine/threonine protein kinase
MKIKQRTRRRSRRKNKTKRVVRGGKVIDSGGYGCVFKPALTCKTIEPIKTTPSNSLSQKVVYVSKLMNAHDAEEEYNLLNKFSTIIIKSGKESMLRFMVLSGITMCHINPSEEDKEDYIKDCSRLAEKNGVNNITELVSLNIPYAGKNLLKMFNDLRVQNNLLNRAIMIDYFKRMRSLFQEGVLLLYETTPKIIHGDIKEENMLCQYNDTFTIYDDIKLIDWGLSFTYNRRNRRDRLEAVRQISRRPLQFNLPFGVLLFSNYFYQKYTLDVLEPLKSKLYSLNELVTSFCNNYYDDSFFKNGKDDSKADSLKDFNTFVYMVMGEVDSSILKTSLTNHIRNHLFKILIKYTVNGKFNKYKYAYEYYLPMVDTYSFILTYSNVLSYLLQTRKNIPRMTSTSNIDKLIIFITEQLKECCFEFDETINGYEYRKKVSHSIHEMTELCMKMLK